MTWQASTRNKFNVGFDIQNNCLCHNGQTALNSPDSAYKTIYGLPLTLSQLKWNFPVNNRLLLEAGSSTLLFNWPNYRMPESFGAIRVVDAAETTRGEHRRSRVWASGSPIRRTSARL